MCGGSASTESDNCDGIEISKCACRIRDAVVSLAHKFLPKATTGIANAPCQGRSSGR